MYTRTQVKIYINRHILLKIVMHTFPMNVLGSTHQQKYFSVIYFHYHDISGIGSSIIGIRLIQVFRAGVYTKQNSCFITIGMKIF